MSSSNPAADLATAQGADLLEREAKLHRIREEMNTAMMDLQAKHDDEIHTLQAHIKALEDENQQLRNAHQAHRENATKTLDNPSRDKLDNNQDHASPNDPDPTSRYPTAISWTDFMAPPARGPRKDPEIWNWWRAQGFRPDATCQPPRGKRARAAAAAGKCAYKTKACNGERRPCKRCGIRYCNHHQFFHRTPEWKAKVRARKQ